MTVKTTKASTTSKTKWVYPWWPWRVQLTNPFKALVRSWLRTSHRHWIENDDGSFATVYHLGPIHLSRGVRRPRGW